MATCKDCIHYYVCDLKGANCREDIGFGSDVIFITDSLKVEEQCDNFFPDVVRCKNCVLHGHCKTEDVFLFSRLKSEIAFCCVGKRKENDNG